MIDTLREAKKLEEAGFSPEQAAAIVSFQYKQPSWVLRDLERSGFERQQALAVLDFLWSVRNENLMRHPRLQGLISGAAVSLIIFGIYFILAVSFGWHPQFHP